MTRFVISPAAFASVPEHNDRERRVQLVELDVKKIDSAWRLQGRFNGYVGANGEGGKPSKYLGVQSWLEYNDEIYVPILLLDFTRAPEKFRFENGRHTFAYFRDRGHPAMPFGIPSEVSEIFKTYFGVA